METGDRKQEVFPLGETPVWGVRDDWQGWEPPLLPTRSLLLGKAASTLPRGGVPHPRFLGSLR